VASKSQPHQATRQEKEGSDLTVQVTASEIIKEIVKLLIKSPKKEIRVDAVSSPYK